MITTDYLRDFRRRTEAKWQSAQLRPQLFGFQIQPGTHWNPGLADEQIEQFERTLGFRFPADLTMLLHEMNGTDLPTVNLYGSTGQPKRLRVGVYSFPRDIDELAYRVEVVNRSRAAIVEELRSQGFVLPSDASLFPFYLHRYVVCGSDASPSKVLSIEGMEEVDAIVYADSLKDYLEKEFLAG